MNHLPALTLLLSLLLLLSVISDPSVAVADEQFKDLEDIMTGFEDEDGTPVPDDSRPVAEDETRFWDLGGSVSLASSINYLDHCSATGTDYTGLQKLRARLNLQLDLDLPRNWKGRIAGYSFYDFAYLIHGRDEYTDDVLDEYEWEADFQEVYLQGNLTEDLDLKLGRQIVNWGRSDTLRVIDVLNPLDNREPGLADIEDLRLPLVMARMDYYLGNWTLTAIAVPEIRFDKLPPAGSDFVPAGALLPGVGKLPPEEVPDDLSGDTEWAAAAMGIFHGWDVSFHFARYWEDWPHVALVPLTPENPFGIVQKHSRVTLVGSGANYTLGSWLLKGEVAYLDGLDYAVGDTVLVTEFGAFPVPTGTVETSRVDAMGGVEYYGFTDTTIALEVVNRHINDYERRMRLFDARQDEIEAALRISMDFFNARLHTTALGVIFGEKAQDGSIVRLSAEYELRDALLVGGGLLLYQNGDPLEFSEIDENDRIFLETKYSF